MSSYPIGMAKSDLDTPCLCLDAAALERNIEKMAAFCRARPVRARPHSKTHKCPTIAWMQMNAGAIGITCAKLGEAEVMAQAGIRDLLIANQILGAQKIARLINLAAYSEVMVAVDDADNAKELSDAAEAKGLKLRAIIEVDVGMGRCGTAPGEETLALAQQMVRLPGLRFEGIMGYEGFAVMIPDMEVRRQKAEEAMQKLLSTADLLRRKGIPVGIVSAAGTGTYHITGEIPGITELQVGSYATMDAKYKSVGADFECALTILARVISVHGDVAIIDAGMKTMTHEFGLPPVLHPEGWTLVKLSEEHGFLQRQGGEPLRRGDLVELIPSHGCTTINLHDAYWVMRNGVLEAVWPIAARGCIR
ncbi:MAG: DSD1 family PLP-dependent enzyme [Chloroflexi bacterium]|nr:DSD1 family PLP-dependent enzyme [Chloroflexota bacterium]